MKRVAFKLLDRGEKHGTGGQEQPTAILGQVPIAPGILDGLLQEALLLCRLGTGEVCVRGLPPAAFAPFEAHGLHVVVPGFERGKIRGVLSGISPRIPPELNGMAQTQAHEARLCTARLARHSAVTVCPDRFDQPHLLLAS